MLKLSEEALPSVHSSLLPQPPVAQSWAFGHCALLSLGTAAPHLPLWYHRNTELGYKHCLINLMAGEQ